MDANIFMQLCEHIPVGVAVFDRNVRLQLFNSAWAGIITRYRSPDFVDISPGVHITALVPELESGVEFLREQMLTGETFRHNAFCVIKEDAVYTWDITAAPLREKGKITGFVLIHKEVSAPVEHRNLPDEAVRIISEHALEIQRRERIADSMRGVLGILNSNRSLDEVLDYIVKQASQLLGADAVAIYKLHDDALLRIQAAYGLDEDYVLNVQIPVGDAAVGKVVLTRQPMAIPDMAKVIPEANKVIEQRNDPVRAAFLERLRKLVLQYRGLLVVPLIVKGEPYGGIALYYTKPREHTNEDIDLAVTFGIQAALAIENTRLHSQLEEAAVAAERSRLARDLHDAVTQTLFSASLIAEVLPRIWERSPEEGRKRLDELRGLTRGALAEMRTLLLELRPAALLESELGDLLRHLAEATIGRSGVTVGLNTEGSRELPADVQIALYRIAQEALNNVVKHAHASAITVSLRMTSDTVAMSITDNGHGFDPASASPDSLGLKIMHERAEAIGAEFRVSSHPGDGTSITVKWHAAERSTR